ncbi:MAG: sulfatase, partial [Planctomycetota bacterium]
NIDAIAEEGILFENVITPVPQTLPAHCSMLTGTIPPYHGVHDNLGYQLRLSSRTLAEIMREHDYTTSAVVSSFVLDSQFGLNQGFDYYDDHLEKATNTSATDFNERTAGETTKRAIKWIEQHKEKRSFLFLHYFDPHYRYEPPEPFRSEYSDNLYAGEIAYTDHCIGQVIRKLKELDLYDSTLLVITSDHGEMLGEHGEFKHGYFVYQSSIRVPLIFRLPGQRKARRIEGLVGLIDIMPTIFGLLGIAPPPQVQGVDLSDCIRSLRQDITTAQRFIYCESLTPTKHKANALLGVVTDSWKYIKTTRPELYDLKKDPGESNNLVEEKPQRVHFLREHLELILEQHSFENNIDTELQLDLEGKKRLESLGYIASISVDERLEFDPDRPDPKDIIQFHDIAEYNRMTMFLVQEGRLGEAAEAFKMIIRHYEKSEIQHDMATIHFNLAMVLKELGQRQESLVHFHIAAEQFRVELEANPSLTITWIRLADTLVKLSDLKGAIRLITRGLQFMSRNGQETEAIELQNYLRYINSANPEEL